VSDECTEELSMLYNVPNPREDESFMYIFRSENKCYPWLEFDDDDRFCVFKRSTKLGDIYATI
jgi:hypothetical protein